MLYAILKLRHRAFEKSHFLKETFFEGAPEGRIKEN